ncbi:MAG: signal recognition particle protein [Flavobacteriales bacterium Tduv]
MFENLQDKLDRALHVLKGRGKITEINVSETLKEVCRALIDADVSFKVAKDFTNTVKEKALGQKVITALDPSQLMVKIVHDELATLMGGKYVDINLSGAPAIILIAGLQGSGKTTFSAKFAYLLKNKRQKHPLLIAADVYRPAAIDQLKVLGMQIDVPVFTSEGNQDPVDIVQKAINQSKEKKNNVVIIDTAGRLAVDEEMMDEIQRVHQAVNPTETLFVVDAMTGQDAVKTAKTFHEVLNFDGVVLTKLDGDTRGGAALSIRSVVKKPIKFISSGEKMEELDLFHPERMADRILGMGDVVSFVERTQEQFDEKETRRINKKIIKSQFDFDDFLKQIQQIKKMGSLKDLVGMMPGIGKVKDMDIQDDAFKQTETIIYSMTPHERQNPKIIDTSRKKRIAKGSGVPMEAVNLFLKQFSKMSGMMKCMQSPSGRQMMKKMMNRQMSKNKNHQKK